MESTTILKYGSTNLLFRDSRYKPVVCEPKYAMHYNLSVASDTDTYPEKISYYYGNIKGNIEVVEFFGEVNELFHPFIEELVLEKNKLDIDPNSKEFINTDKDDWSSDQC